MSSSGAKKRRPNFTETEKVKLIDLLLEDKELATGVFGSHYKSSDDMKQGWNQIADILNSCNHGITERTGEEVKNKFTDLKSRVKQKHGRIMLSKKKTGGGDKDTEELTPLEEKMLTFIGVSAVQGIEGGLDSGCTDFNVECDESIEMVTTEIKGNKENEKPCGSKRAYTSPRKDKSFEAEVITQYQKMNENVGKLTEVMTDIRNEIRDLKESNICDMQ